MIASLSMQCYFQKIDAQVTKAHLLATRARSKGYDPTSTVEISLAKNMAERVVGIISVVAPQIVNSGVVERIMELEKQYGALDWRVALKIAEEVAYQKFCTFATKKEAIEVGIRTGFAYSTVGVVSSPLDGFIGLEFKQRLDGKGEYICANYAGPIRNAGGTNAAVSVLITDYVRKKMGYTTYDPTPEEIKRACTELQDYHERITNLQYVPSEEEVAFLLSNLPVEVSGDPSEQIEVSNYKDLPRIQTNLIRSGYCLMLSSCLCLKAPKLWKQISKWGAEFELSHWNFLKEFLVIQKKAKADGVEQKAATLTPDYTFIHDLVAGRPVFSHPLRTGGFRLRYGRTRISGYSSCAVHPATMFISNQYLATGTQIKIERPSKGSAIVTSELIDGPIVKLNDGSVLQLQTIEQAREYAGMIQEIIFLGDLLVSYGDFFNRAHTLIPAGYCPEWWAPELEKVIVNTFGSLDVDKAAELTGVHAAHLQQILGKPLVVPVSVQEALALTKLGAPLHPSFTYYWSTISHEQLETLLEWLGHAMIGKDTNQHITQLILAPGPAKRVLEVLGIPHVVSDNTIILSSEHATALLASLGFPLRSLGEIKSFVKSKNEEPLLLLNQLAGFIIRDKAGTFIGARMGRPEKAKMRKLTGSPHVLFPVGDEGGKYRSVQNALTIGGITAEFPQFFCNKCVSRTPFSVCPQCDTPSSQLWYCKQCRWISSASCAAHGPATTFGTEVIDIRTFVQQITKKLGMQTYPDLIKGVRGTSNKNHVPEHLAKGILRAKHEIYVNKDGTTRYDMTQLPMTHFRPKELGTSVEKLIELGYTHDIHEQALTDENQVCELKPQDIVLPSCDESPDEKAEDVLFRLATFVDDELRSMYGLPSFYNLKSPVDLIGHLVVCLAPHTSAGMVGRIIGFSKTQGFFAHPLLHAATRRDCDGDEATVILLMDAFLNFSKRYLPDSRGSTMDAPLVLTTLLIPSEVDDMAFDLDIGWHYPLELYEAALQFKMPWDVPVPQIKAKLGTPEQYERMGFTHDCSDMNATVRCSAYKTLPSMEEKLKGQMELAEKIRAVETADVARLVIEKHFIKDAKGNLRKFSEQEFRCVNCNEKYRRPPLIGKCLKCSGKLIFTVSEGNVVKYLEPMISLAKKYNLSPYLQQTIELLRRRIESVFGKEKEKQTGLGAWFG